MKTNVIFLAILAGIVLIGHKAYRDTLTLKSIDSYESCVAAKGSRIQESYPATCVTRLGTRFTQPHSSPTPTQPTEVATQYISDIKSLVGKTPPEWQGATISGNYLWNDLIQVCVDFQIQGSFDECDYFEYWTNYRTGKWNLLGRYSAGQEGPSCEFWEKWKVAAGMECNRLKDGITSRVTF